MLTLALGLAALPAAKAEDTGFNFNTWFEGLKTMDVPEVVIQFQFGENARKLIYCETRSPVEQVRWCTGGTSPAYKVEIKDKDGAPAPQARDLPIGIEWETATGETGYGPPATIPPVYLLPMAS